jgi:hypothetical protein
VSIIEIPGRIVHPRSENDQSIKDGNTNITMEADAGDLDLTYPVFDIYDDRRKTFHARFSKLYHPATTIVLKKR